MTPKKSSANNGKLSQAELEEIRQALLNKRRELTRYQATQLSELRSPEKHHLADLEEMASDTMDTDSLCEIMDIGSNTLEQIDAALEKLDDGTYGICESCDKPIPHARLEALPFAGLCVNCQREKEQRAEVEGLTG
jgi:DnaK suppressor protein